MGSPRAGHDLGTKHAQSRQKFLFLIWYLSLAVADLPLGRAEGWRAGPGHSHHAYLGSSWEKGHFIPSLEPDLAGGCPTQVPSLHPAPNLWAVSSLCLYPLLTQEAQVLIRGCPFPWNSNRSASQLMCCEDSHQPGPLLDTEGQPPTSGPTIVKPVFTNN